MLRQDIIKLYLHNHAFLLADSKGEALRVKERRRPHISMQTDIKRYSNVAHRVNICFPSVVDKNHRAQKVAATLQVERLEKVILRVC